MCRGAGPQFAHPTPWTILTLLFRTTKEPSHRDSTAEELRQAAKRVGDAMHVTRRGAGFLGTSAADEVFGQVRADGHKKARKNPPPPQAR